MSAESQLLDAIPRVTQQRDLFVPYAEAIAVSLAEQEKVNWERVNTAIVDRWSASGLARIKNAAWKVYARAAKEVSV
jgi:hypothetical protein